MQDVYSNPNLLARMANLRGIERHIRHHYGEAERILTLAVATDPDSGLVVCSLSLEDLMEGSVGLSTLIALYPLAQQASAAGDAWKVAQELGLRLRLATPGVGWEWVESNPDLSLPRGGELVIGG